MKLEDLATEAFIESLVLDVLYDRGLCKEIGIDYCRIDSADVEKARQYVRRFYQLQDAGGSDERYK